MNGLGIPEDALVNRKLRQATTQQDKMEILWKAILGRLPKKSEEPLFDNAPDDVMWALINSMNSGLGDKQMERRDFIYRVGLAGASLPFLDATAASAQTAQPNRSSTYFSQGD